VFPPSAPEPPFVSERHATSCTVTYEHPRRDGGAPVTGYILERRTPGPPDSEWIRVNDSPITDLQYTVDNLTPKTQYEFRVAAVNKKGTSEFSPISLMIVTPVEMPGKPGCPEVLEVIGTSVRLQWTAPDSDGGAAITQYTVVYFTTGDDPKYVPFPVDVTDGESTSYTLRNLLQPSTMYLFAVAAVNIVGTGPWSDWKKGVTAHSGTLRTCDDGWRQSLSLQILLTFDRNVVYHSIEQCVIKIQIANFR